MIITTAGRTKASLTERARQLSNQYNLHYVTRKKDSITALKRQYQQDVLVVGSDQLYLSPLHQTEKVFFHPSLAMIRAKRIANGESDTFISATGLKTGMSLLDCTLGLACDSTIASLVVGEAGKVTGLEGSASLSILLKEGLSTLDTGFPILNEAMRRIEVIGLEHLSHLQTLPDNSYDVVYFDPMFTETITESIHIQALQGTVLSNSLSGLTIEEAKRVASRRVVLKDHWQSKRFVQFGFTQLKRKTSLFHYGIMDI
ncbi:class I SAM-dependent methyltransferase [Gracilibacillus phocaeensis]|uniref:class I SAM-dependent methyltransferase n=1 Tax=Gracilibacillus phocaeensis TaxID=2042304 RepID=UPI00102F6D50|nr:class I SAM-dependent methyltransferase [Gracilibacillus phocaeensis]